MILEALGYRRYEWKCDALNAPSRRVALRFGFTFEGHFRRAVITRGRSRDTARFSIIDEERPALKAACERWLAPENFRRAGAAEDAAQRTDGGAGGLAPVGLIHPDPAGRGAAIFPAAQIPDRGRPRDSEVPDRLPSTTGCSGPDTLRPYALNTS